MLDMRADELKERRARLGLNQRALAAVFGVHYMTVSKWERGEHRIPEMVGLALDTLERWRAATVAPAPGAAAEPDAARRETDPSRPPPDHPPDHPS